MFIALTFLTVLSFISMVTLFLTSHFLLSSIPMVILVACLIRLKTSYEKTQKKTLAFYSRNPYDNYRNQNNNNTTLNNSTPNPQQKKKEDDKKKKDNDSGDGIDCSNVDCCD